MRWFEIDPLDTLFFRGAEPMEPGETHVQSLEFPPLPQTLIGAVRTAALARAGVTFMPGWQNTVNGDVRLSIGVEPEPPATFCVMGPLFAYKGELLYPVPADWRRGTDGRVSRLILKEPDLINRWRVCHSGGPVSLPWLQQEAGKDAEVKGWVTAASLAAGDRGERVDLIDQETLFTVESRVGLALNGRRAKEGHLYSTSHIRLRSGVTILFGLDGVAASVFPDDGLLQWGGEQRLECYRKHDPVRLPQAESGSRWLAVVPMEASRLNLTAPALQLDGQSIPLATWVSGKFRKVGGWDLANRRHKPLMSWFPAGAVFYPAQQPDQQLRGLAERNGFVWI
jgi:CRISPR-associated protein Cmr3